MYPSIHSSNSLPLSLFLSLVPFFSHTLSHSLLIYSNFLSGNPRKIEESNAEGAGTGDRVGDLRGSASGKRSTSHNSTLLDFIKFYLFVLFLFVRLSVYLCILFVGLITHIYINSTLDQFLLSHSLVCMWTCLFNHEFICLPICLPICIFICISICLSVCISIC